MVSGLEIRGRSLDPEAMGERGVDELSIVEKMAISIDGTFLVGQFLVGKVLMDEKER